MKNKKVLIIGGAGYKGVEITKLLLDNDFKVKILDTFWFGDNFKKNLKIKKIKKNKADVYKTHGDNKLLSKFIGYKIRRKFDNDLFRIVKWFDMVKKDRYF